MKHSLKNALPLYRKTASSGKKIEENDFQEQENVFLLKLVSPNYINGFQQKKALNKNILFPLDRK